MTTELSQAETCSAPASVVYGLISDVSEWPTLLQPCRSARTLSSVGGVHLVEIEALVGGRLMSWRSRRRLLPEVFGVEAEIVEPMPLVEWMRTSWRVFPLNEEQCVLVLEHAYEVAEHVVGLVDGVETRADAERFMASAVERNSRTELADFSRAAERRHARTGERDYTTRHSVVVDAPPADVYALIRDVAGWPQMFDACVGVDVVERDDSTELVRVEAMQHGRRVHWETLRRYQDDIHRIDYELVVPMPFVEAMSGEWRAVALDGRRTLLTVDRRWRISTDLSDVPDGVGTVAGATAFVSAFVDDNARAEMESIRAYVAGETGLATAVAVRRRVPCAPGVAFALLAEAADWPDEVPVGAAVACIYDDGVNQIFELRHGETDSTGPAQTSIRTLDVDRLSISFFQTQPQGCVRTHRGAWFVRPVPGGSELIARCNLVVDESAAGRQFDVRSRNELTRRASASVASRANSIAERCVDLLSASPPQASVSVSA